MIYFAVKSHKDITFAVPICFQKFHQFRWNIPWAVGNDFARKLSFQTIHDSQLFQPLNEFSGLIPAKVEGGHEHIG